MPAILTDIVNILTTTPGNLVYHLLLAAFILSSLSIAIHLQRGGSLPFASRLAAGLGLLLAARLALFGAGLVTLPGLVSEGLLLPPLDRAVSLLSLTILLWMWLYPAPLRMADLAHILLGLLALTTLGLTLAWWSGQAEGLAYNGTWPDFIGLIAQLVILGFGLLFLLLRRPPGWGPGLGMFLLLAAGQGAQLYFSPEGDYQGLARLAEIMAYPLLITLPLRFPILAPALPLELPALPAGMEPEAGAAAQAAAPEQRQAWLAVLNAGSAAEACPAIARLVALAMGADLCLLLSPPGEDGQVPIRCTYDLEAGAPLQAAPALDGRRVPVLVSTLRLGRPVRMPASSTSPDLAALAQALGLNQAGGLLSAPILGADDLPAYALLLLTPRSRRNWNADDQAALAELSRALAQVLHRLDLLDGLQTRLAEKDEALRAALREAAAENESAGAERGRLLSQFESLRQELDRERARAEGLAALLAASETAAQEKAASAAAQVPAEVERLQGELTLALEEIARLDGALTGLQARSSQTAAGTHPGPEAERVAAIAAELNRPAQSISEYAGRLLAEAGGGLDEPQRRMLERIRLSGERMRSLVEDLRRALEQPAAAPDGRAELAAAANAALARLAPRAAGRQLNLRQEIPAGLPALHLDPGALERLLLVLLGEAVHTAPAQGEIVLQAELQQESGQPDYLLIQVANGGNPLPAARGLAESLNGRLWLDDDPKSGSSRANLLLPVSQPERVEPRNGVAAARTAQAGKPAVEEP